jgi:hypothetical protein
MPESKGHVLYFDDHDDTHYLSIYYCRSFTLHLMAQA